MLTEQDITRLRSETPGCEDVLHFNNAGAALVPQVVLDTQVDYLKLEAMTGGYEAKADSMDRFEGVYQSLAVLLNADPSEIALMENATAAWLAAFTAIPFKAGDRILTARESYASNYVNFLLWKERYGVEVDVIDVTETGELSVDDLKRQLTERTRLLAITHIPTGGGLVNPAEELGEVELPDNCYYLLDGCQSAGQIPIDVQALNCDFYSATGRKWLRGPRGTGFLYASQKAWSELTPSVLDLHSAELDNSSTYTIRNDARRFENWESSIAAQLALGTAVDYALDIGLEVIWQRVQHLSSMLRAGLSDLPGITVHDTGKQQCGIVTFSSKKENPATIQQRLRKQSINVSMAVPSGTILDSEARGLPRMIRASTHYYNTEDEVERFVSAIAD